jgi:hypothetical protein
MTSNTFDVKVQLIMKMSMMSYFQKIDDVMIGDIKHEESYEVSGGEHRDHHEETWEKPMWIKKLADGSSLKLDDKQNWLLLEDPHEPKS